MNEGPGWSRFSAGHESINNRYLARWCIAAAGTVFEVEVETSLAEKDQSLLTGCVPLCGIVGLRRNHPDWGRPGLGRRRQEPRRWR